MGVARLGWCKNLHNSTPRAARRLRQKRDVSDGDMQPSPVLSANGAEQ